MELALDWKIFQSFFYTKRKLTQTEPHGPIFLVTDNKVVTAAFSEGEDLFDWVGATSDEVAAEFAHRDVMAYDRAKVEQWMVQAGDMPHFYDQRQFLRNEAKPVFVSKGRGKGHTVPQSHFLLQALEGWWHKLLPSTFGIYLSLDNQPTDSILLVFQRGRIQSFYVPDLNSLPPGRKQAQDKIKYLSEQHLIPIQGFFITRAEWTEWSEMQNPWPKIFKTLKANRHPLVPSSWTWKAMILARAHFGI